MNNYSMSTRNNIIAWSGNNLYINHFMTENDDNITSLGDSFYIKTNNDVCKLIGLVPETVQDIRDHIFYKDYKSIKFLNLSRKQKHYDTISPNVIYFYFNTDADQLFLVQFLVQKSEISARYDVNFYFGTFNIGAFNNELSKFDEIIINHSSNDALYRVSIYDNFVLINDEITPSEPLIPLTIYFTLIRAPSSTIDEDYLPGVRYFNYRLIKNAKSIDGADPICNKNGKYINDIGLIIMEEYNKTIIYNILKDKIKKLDYKMVLYNDDINNRYMGASNKRITFFPVNNKLENTLDKTWHDKLIVLKQQINDLVKQNNNLTKQINDLAKQIQYL